LTDCSPRQPPDPVAALIDMHFDVHGDGTKPYLLLMHGFLSSRAQWRANLDALACVSTPVTVELLGHGRSASPEDHGAYAVAAYVRRFEALRERLGAERWFICGQSFGAGLTIRYALEHPERVIGQVFTNSVSGLSPPLGGSQRERAVRAAAFEAGGREALEALPFYPRPSKRLAREVWEDLVADAELITPAAIARAMMTTVPELSVAADLGRISVPTLLVNGTREAAFQPLRDLASREIPGVKIVDVEGGHSINLDRPDAFNAAVAAFISRLTPS
jgi:2-succinyl-6-hydroxy-2,4-cyclohexadiene-1-carboxylate synthase